MPTPSVYQKMSFLSGISLFILGVILAGFVISSCTYTILLEEKDSVAASELFSQQRVVIHLIGLAVLAMVALAGGLLCILCTTLDTLLDTKEEPSEEPQGN